MSEARLRRRSRLKHKEAAALRAALLANLPGATLWPDQAAVEVADFEGTQVGVVDGRIHVLVEADAGPFLTVRGLLAYRPPSRGVTVDMGAVPFVHNGADIMAPGIVEADEGLAEGDWCWVRDERNKQPLAVGRCLVPAASMVRGKGRAVRSVHHLGDKLWGMDG